MSHSARKNMDGRRWAVNVIDIPVYSPIYTATAERTEHDMGT